MLQLPLVKVTKQQEETCGPIPNTGRSQISPPFRPPLLCFDCLPPPPPVVARFASVPSSQRKLAAAPLPETPGEGDCPPHTANSFGDAALDSGKPGLNQQVK